MTYPASGVSLRCRRWSCGRTAQRRDGGRGGCGGLGGPAAARQARLRLALRRRRAARQARHPRTAPGPPPAWRCTWPTERSSAPSTRSSARSCPAPPLVTGVAAGAGRAPRRSGRSAAWSTAATRRATSSSRSPATARAFAQATWRHLLFGVVLGEIERRLNDIAEFEPLEDVPGLLQRPRQPRAAPAVGRPEPSPRLDSQAAYAGVAQLAEQRSCKRRSSVRIPPPAPPLEQHLARAQVRAHLALHALEGVVDRLRVALEPRRRSPRSCGRRGRATAPSSRAPRARSTGRRPGCAAPRRRSPG